MQSFENIFIAGNRDSSEGKFKVSEAGLGWKSSLTGEIVTIPSSDILNLSFIPVARDHQLRIERKNRNVLRFDGFKSESYDELMKACRQWFKVQLVQVETSKRGYNWGSAEFEGDNLSFVVQGKQAFEIPLNQVINSTANNKSEVQLEFNGGGIDQLVELRFYVPGGVFEGQLDDTNDTPTLKDRTDDSLQTDANMEQGEISQKQVVDEKGEVVSAASLFCETIKLKSNAGVSTSELIVAFDDLLSLTPRGRFKVDLYADFFRLVGKSYDYRIQYSAISRMFLVPRPDDLHWHFVVGIFPALRQGQTKYPYLVFQFERDDEVELDLNLDQYASYLTGRQVLDEKYKGRLLKAYDGPTFQTVADIFHGIVGKKVTGPSASYKSIQGFHSIRCAHKATESLVYPLEKAILCIQKPPVYFAFSEIVNITFSRVSTAAVTTTKNIEMKFSLTNGTDYSYSSIPREEHSNLEAYFRSKKLVIRNEIEEAQVSYVEGGSGRRNKTIADYQDDLLGSESEDDDFVTKEDSDVDEEFDSEFSSEEEGGEGESKTKKRSRDDSADGSDDDGGEDDEESLQEPKQSLKAKGKSSGPSATKKKKKEGPKRALTSYIYFSNETRSKVKAEHPEYGLGEVAKELGVQWKALSAEEKKPFEEMASKDKERYAKDLEEFKRTGIVPGNAKSSKVGKSGSESVPKPSKMKEESKVKSEEYIVDSDADDF